MCPDRERSASVRSARRLGLALLAGVLLALPIGARAAGVRVVSDQVYAPNGQRLDLCVPTEFSAPTSTVVVFVHGGGFVSGDKRDMLAFCRRYAEAGFVSATLNYRLSGEAPYPAAVEDVEAALAFIATNVRPYDRAPARVVLVGYSAGGTLALLARHPLVAARVSGAGPTDLSYLLATATQPQLVRDLRAFLGTTLPDAVSPIRRDYIAKTPVFLFHGKDDALVSVVQAVALADVLKRQGGQVLLRVFDGVGHEVMLPNPHLQQLEDELLGFLRAVDAAP